MALSRIGRLHPDFTEAAVAPATKGVSSSIPGNTVSAKASRNRQELLMNGALRMARVDGASLRCEVAKTLTSRNPKNPSLFLDLPTKDGAAQPDVLVKWAANARLAFVDQYVGNLRQYRAISIDVSDQDGLRAEATRLREALDTYGIVNSFEVYPGTHTSRVVDRFRNHVLKFFGQNLCFKEGCR
jgi:hypothetical protein